MRKKILMIEDIEIEKINYTTIRLLFLWEM